MNDGENQAAEIALLEAAAIDDTKGPVSLMALIAYQNAVLRIQIKSEATTCDEDDPAIHPDCGAIMNKLTEQLLRLLADTLLI